MTLLTPIQQIFATGLLFALTFTAPGELWGQNLPPKKKSTLSILTPPTQHQITPDLKKTLKRHLHDIPWQVDIRPINSPKLSDYLIQAKAQSLKNPALRAVVWIDPKNLAFITIYVCHATVSTKKLITRPLSSNNKLDDMGLILRQILPTLPTYTPPTLHIQQRQKSTPPTPKATTKKVMTPFAIALDTRVGLEVYGPQPIARAHFQIGIEWRTLYHLALLASYARQQPINQHIETLEINLQHQALRLGLGHYWAFVRGRFRTGIDLVFEDTQGTLTHKNNKTTIEQTIWFVSPNMSWHQHLTPNLSVNLFGGLHIAPRRINYSIDTQNYQRFRLMPYIQMGLQWFWPRA